jgi:hypothetical protein
MNIDIELEASDLRALDEHDRRRQQHQLQHWHPLDPERLDDALEEPPEQEISITGVELLSQDGQQLEKHCQQLLKKVDNS